MNKFLFSLSVISLFTIGFVFSQNDMQSSQFTFNELSFNPANAASTPNIVVSLSAREQWAGFKEAPSTQFLNAYTNIDGIGGIGLSVINDKLGYEKSLGVHVVYARKFPLSDKNSFSLGAGLGFMNKSIDYDKLVFEQGNDQTALASQKSELKSDFSFGASLDLAAFHFSLSSTHLTQSLNKSTFYKTPRHYYIFTKYTIKASDRIDVAPSVFVKSSEFINQYEVNTNVFLDKKYWLGVSYRFDESAVALVGFTINNQFQVGYSYDFNLGPIKTYSNGSHEIMVLAKFKGFKQKSAPKSFFN
ncbi:MAG: type IX secretion system membrane protein PorP/SprF [Bacteroidetes bacterium]|nr:type IX secretion system membrane protein PorP/SprF [Bacteroidota bacterium]